MTDTEIYIDGHATSTFRTLYESLEEQRQTIIQKYKQADKDFYSKTILAAEVKEEDFFCHVTHKTWDAILHDIRKAHEHDIDSTPDYSLAKKMRITLPQRKWRWIFGKPFNPPGIISERCGRSFSIRSALTFTSCRRMNRRY